VLGTDGRPALQHYYRIVAVNNPEKQNDVLHHLTTFHGHPFVLYLTSIENNFELVVVDETDVFIHFYKEEKVIASSLHIEGRSVAREFVEVFDRMRMRGLLYEFDCKQITKRNLIENLSIAEKVFDNVFHPDDGKG
jgi:hypothetical protein